MPFFSFTCAFHGCHDSLTRKAGLYLGSNFVEGIPDAAVGAEALASLLSKSTTAPALFRVKAFEPGNSFVLIKLQGCQNHLGLDCPDGLPAAPCGNTMPYLSPELRADQKSLIARWIAEGAQGN
jgi:hypothetical protein